MANNVDLDALLAQIPVDDIAKQLGVDEDTALGAVKQTLPGLLGGMAVNASDAEGEQKLVGALDKHTPKDGKISLDAVDTEDGKKIVKHVLGDKEEAVTNALSTNAQSSGIAKLIPMLLPILAPIVMQFLAGKFGGGAEKTQQQSEGGIAGGLGDLLGGLLGGGSGSSTAASSGGLGDILGGLLGGGSGGASSGSNGGGLGGLLGGLLGR
ncbi:DUF937 domain-containing protein [Leucobacter denitrificans]|uniref:DUF937 domain-containing protein n=1 Tax=Leucobacter denitrificans TaxID=683042 RepID=A0A7G9S1Z3_9MICO|nr:DUF937 domain-containing protein [Leucobacter denitrificans]QNN61868.1 DUF937 domain-containing protein [Leucobacter denitrificans]